MTTSRIPLATPHRQARPRPPWIVVGVASAVLAAAALTPDAHGAVVPAQQIPATATTPAGFAPPGWRVEKRATGDLDGDGDRDQAIVLIQSESGGAAYGVVDGSRALLLARNEAGGLLRRVGLAPRLLGCAECGGAFWGAARMPVGVAIANRTVVVRQQFGGRSLSATTHRLRWHAPTGKFRLVGLDTLVTDRLTGLSVAVSTNHLTRRQTTTRKRGAKLLSKVTRTVPVAPRPIAGLRFGNLRP
jgi:hypothetical protein